MGNTIRQKGAGCQQIRSTDDYRFKSCIVLQNAGLLSSGRNQRDGVENFPAVNGQDGKGSPNRDADSDSCHEGAKFKAGSLLKGAKQISKKGRTISAEPVA